ncbi:immunity protein Imm33 domain-containing protein [Paenibacillus puerhi]|uniref:immunity protein Imm33 domain-containing protein n=1 Tax=Paenibacillus puerhi TaxID=2692622 RepID=UPI00135B9248|nr:hypothetical protein [Paenibacillus puerhi]
MDETERTNTVKSIRGISIENDGVHLVTNGLKSKLGFELRVASFSKEIEEYYKVLKYLVDYLLDSKPKIIPEQTISYHSWLLKFVMFSDSTLDVWEAERQGNGFVEGVEYALQVRIEQEDECSNYGVTPSFPTFGQNIVISKGVYEGLGVDAVRYPSPEHMTGWWVTTDLYDGDTDSLMKVHFYHVAFNRPDLLRYFALPFGFRFYINETENDIWFDENTLK